MKEDAEQLIKLSEARRVTMMLFLYLEKSCGD